MKICKRCGKEKELTEFHIDRSKKDGHKNICKQCLSQKKYHSSNIDRNIRQSLIYCMKNPNGKSTFRWGRLLGYGSRELIEHIESTFKEGMRWDNYGKVWSVSFIIPKRCYNFSSLRDSDLRKLWNLKNLKAEYNEVISRQKVEINVEEIIKNNLFDILPDGVNLNFTEDISLAYTKMNAIKLNNEYQSNLDKIFKS